MPTPINNRVSASGTSAGFAGACAGTAAPSERIVPLMPTALHIVVEAQATPIMAFVVPDVSALQAVPFHDTIGVPTALHKVVEGQATPFRAFGVPDVSALQAVPFHDTIVPSSPPTLHSVVEWQETPPR